MRSWNSQSDSSICLRDLCGRESSSWNSGNKMARPSCCSCRGIRSTRTCTHRRNSEVRFKARSHQSTSSPSGNKRYVDRQNGWGGGAVLPILPIIVPVKKNQNADRQCYGDGDGVNRCEQTFSMQFQGFMTHYLMHFFLLNKHHWRIQGFLVNIYKIQG